MLCLLVYDIPENKVRTKVADICLDYGLQRIQYSAFLGALNRNRQEELLLKIRRKAGQHDANVQLFAIGAKEAVQRREVVVNGYCLGRSVAADGDRP